MSAKPWSVARLAEHRRIAIDSNVLIYLIEGAEPHASRAFVRYLDDLRLGGPPD